MSAPLTRDDAIDYMARRLFQKFEHIDPSGSTWTTLGEQEREMYRQAIKFALCVPDRYITAARS